MTMPDDATRWRLDRLEESLRDLGQRVVSTDLYARDRAELERDIADLRAALAEERTARQAAVDAEATAREKGDEDEEEDRKRDVQDIKTAMAARGVSWRQAVYAGLFPVLLFLATIVLQIKTGTGK